MSHPIIVSRSTRKGGFTLVELLVVIAIIGILIALLLPAVQAAREAARRAQCSNNLKQIGLALLNYESNYSVLPPGRMGCDKNLGRCPRQEQWVGTSAFVCILPFIEEQSVYDMFDFNDGPWGYSSSWYLGSNGEAIEKRIAAYVCPSDTASEFSEHPQVSSAYNIGNRKAAVGNYATCAGSFGPMPSDVGKSGDYKYSANGVFYYLKAHKIRDISDGLSNTMFAGEVIDPHTQANSNIWSRGLRLQDTNRTTNNPVNTLPDQGFAIDSYGFYYNAAFSSRHPGGAQFVFGDGRVTFVNENMEIRAYQALSTRADGEMYGDTE